MSSRSDSRVPSRAKLLSADLKAEVERRLGPSHADRIARLTQELQRSLAPHLVGPSTPGATAAAETEAAAAAAWRAGDGKFSLPAGHGTHAFASMAAAGAPARGDPTCAAVGAEPRLVDIFDELLAANEGRRAGVLAQELAQQQAVHAEVQAARLEAAQAQVSALPARPPAPPKRPRNAPQPCSWGAPHHARRCWHPLAPARS